MLNAYWYTCIWIKNNSTFSYEEITAHIHWISQLKCVGVGLMLNLCKNVNFQVSICLKYSDTTYTAPFSICSSKVYVGFASGREKIIPELLDATQYSRGVYRNYLGEGAGWEGLYRFFILQGGWMAHLLNLPENRLYDICSISICSMVICSSSICSIKSFSLCVICSIFHMLYD